MRISTHFGLNRVKPSAYGGWDGALLACCNDATAMTALFARAGYDARAFFDGDATVSALRGAIATAADALHADDWYVMTDSGHGSQRDSTFSYDSTVEALCLYDGLLEDHWFLGDICKFREGVNVVVILDCCFSGGMDRGTDSRIRVAPWWVTRQLLRAAREGPRGTPKCNYMLLTACNSFQTAADGEQYGAFTGSLLGQAAGGGETWKDWFTMTKEYMGRHHPRQTPQMIHVAGGDLGGYTIFA